ncbi:MAG: DUF3592 domain-containing protein [Clostridia bacterium]|nr:DUF3592 domain-containing protein [Clostridia bacterium]
MKIFDMIKKYEKVRFAASIIVVSLFISIISGIILFKPEKDMPTVNATITSIEERGTGDDVEHIVTVSYRAGGKKYETELGAYETGWKVGDTIECKYDPEDPSAISTNSGKLMPLIVCLVGAAAVVYGAVSLKKSIKEKSSDLAQYDKVSNEQIDTAVAQEIKNSNEPFEDFVFHFTGKLNQDYVMKNSNGEPVYEALCAGIKLVQDTTFEFKNLITGESSTKMIGHTVTKGYGDNSFSMAVSSAFNIDGKKCWDVLASMGYGFKMTLNGVKAHFDVHHMGVNIGYAELAGTGVMKEKYKDNPLGKVPTNGIFTVKCPKSEIEAMFLICFCLSKTEITVS